MRVDPGMRKRLERVTRDLETIACFLDMVERPLTDQEERVRKAAIGAYDRVHEILYILGSVAVQQHPKNPVDPDVSRG